jgi:hypothetical protein
VPTAEAAFRPWFVWVIVGLVGLMVVVLIGAAMRSDDTETSQADATYQDAPAVAPVTVLSWPGGGEGNDIRNSAPFELIGGHQVVTVAATPLSGEYSNPSLGWYVKAADGREGVELVNPASFGTTRSDLYLPAGSYYLGSNTIDCTWTITITEDR